VCPGKSRIFRWTLRDRRDASCERSRTRCGLFPAGPLVAQRRRQRSSALRHSDEPIDRWSEVLGGLGIGEAAALPITEEAAHPFAGFIWAGASRHHVRHREKYVDVRVPDARAFVFTERGQPAGTRATTLKVFVNALDVMPSEVLEGHARRGDFSRWLAEVFGDYPLALSVRTLEDRSCQERDSAALPAIASTIRGRYDLALDEAGSCQ